MSKQIYDLNKPEDIEELNRVGFLDEEDLYEVPEEYFDESEDSETEDYVETRSSDSETDHEIDNDEPEDEEPQENCFLGM